MQLLDRIAAVARDHPSRVAYRFGDGSAIGYRELAAEIAAASADLPRDRVVIVHLGNVRRMPTMILAALGAGLDCLPIHASATAAEVAALAARVDVSPHASGTLLLTSSGSTGVPKIIRRSAASLDAVAANVVEAIGFEPGDVVLASVPLAHSYGIEHGLLAPLWAGATVELADGLDLPHFSAAIARGVSIFPSVPAVLERLADVEGLTNLRNARAIYSAGGPLPDGVRERFVTRYGVPVGQLYGSTEVGSVTYRRGAEGDGVGWPMRGVSVRVLDLDAPGSLAAPGATGEIAIRAPSMFDRYHDGDSAPLVDGHFLTGDLGHLDAEGSLILTGRSKLLIDTGGPKVDPLEVERTLESHPGVAACVVVPMRQSDAVCRLRAIVVPRAGATPTSAELREFARQRLAGYKVPRVVEFRSELPRSAAGKVARRQLEES